MQQNAGGVVLFVLVACQVVLSSSSSSSSANTSSQHPRHTLLALVRAASALSPPSKSARQSYSFAAAKRPSPFDFAHNALVNRKLPPEQTPEEREPWSKRGATTGSTLEPEGGEQGEQEALEPIQQVGDSLATNFLRHARSSARPYDVPQIECPPAEDQMERFPCPSPDRMGRYRCIDDHVLCDGFIDCPDGEDEDRQQCMFYKTTKAHLDVIADAIIRFIRGRK